MALGFSLAGPSWAFRSMALGFQGEHNPPWEQFILKPHYSDHSSRYFWCEYRYKLESQSLKLPLHRSSAKRSWEHVPFYLEAEERKSREGGSLISQLSLFWNNFVLELLDRQTHLLLQVCEVWSVTLAKLVVTALRVWQVLQVWIDWNHGTPKLPATF